MSVLIKGMEMPKNCDNCEFHLEEDVSFEICHRCQITGKYIDKMDICSFPYDCPLAEQPERKTGRWIYDPEPYPMGGAFGHYECDQCGEWIRGTETNFCPNCGADMRGEQNNV